jgi:hypothetical protein
MSFQRPPPPLIIVVPKGKSLKKGGSFLPTKVPLLLFSVIFSSILALAFLLLLSGHSSAFGHGFDENWKREEEDGKRRLRRQTLPLDNVRVIQFPRVLEKNVCHHRI